MLKEYFYNEEFDPGSGWTLATGLTHASGEEVKANYFAKTTKIKVRITKS